MSKELKRYKVSYYRLGRSGEYSEIIAAYGIIAAEKKFTAAHPDGLILVIEEQEATND